MLTPIKPIGKKDHKTLWECRCDCGAIVAVVSSKIKVQAHCSHSCPASVKAQQAKKITHGMSLHPAYAIWRGMVQRCSNPKNKGFKNYGGRGISVCRAWRTFDRFWLEMGPTFHQGLQLERENNKGPYSKANCVWTTSKVNCRNKRSTVFLAWLHEARDKAGIKWGTFYARVNRGWSDLDAATRPIGWRKPKTTKPNQH